MADWYGAAGGSASGSTYSSATATLDVNALLALSGVRFSSPDARTYSIRVNGAEQAQVVAAEGATAEATFDPVRIESGDTLAIVPVAGGNCRVAYVSGGSVAVSPDVSLIGWAESPGNYSLPWALLLEAAPLDLNYAPIGELDGSPNLLTVSYVVSGLLDDWHRQPHLPVATNAFGRWLMDRAGYVRPDPEVRPPARPIRGRDWPRPLQLENHVTVLQGADGEGEVTLDSRVLLTLGMLSSGARFRLYQTAEGRTEDASRPYSVSYVGDDLQYDATGPLVDLGKPVLVSYAAGENTFYYRVDNGPADIVLVWS